MQVIVRDNNVDQALRALKKKMQREGIFREMKLRGHYEKPSEKKTRRKAESIRRAPQAEAQARPERSRHRPAGARTRPARQEEINARTPYAKFPSTLQLCKVDLFLGRVNCF